jgi:hypothetical protein
MMRRSNRGVALLMVVSAIAILALVLIEFSNSARTHMNAGVNVRDEMRASVMADTALVMTRACLDERPWGAMAGAMGQVDLKKVCDIMLGIFVRGRVDLPVGGLSVELEGVEGLGLSKGDIEELELVPEETFIGLAGLECKSKAGQAIVDRQVAAAAGQANPADNQDVVQACGSRMTVVKQLRSLLCDPAISDWFETERADGKKYTREQIVGYIIDWVDPDDNGVTIDPLTWIPRQGTGDNEDSYYSDGDERYRSKDAAFDSIEELRMVKGIDDELYHYLSPKLSVHAESKINMNNAGTEIIASVIRAHNAGFDILEGSSCGENAGDLNDDARHDLNRYAGLVVEARRVKEQMNMLSMNLMGRTFRTPQAFVQLAKDPIKQILAPYAGDQGIGGNAVLTELMVLEKAGFKRPELYYGIRDGTNWGTLQRQLTFKDKLFRLRVKGRVGNMTRTLFAILRKEGQSVRVVYYREE